MKFLRYISTSEELAVTPPPSQNVDDEQSWSTARYALTTFLAVTALSTQLAFKGANQEPEELYVAPRALEEVELARPVQQSLSIVRRSYSEPEELARITVEEQDIPRVPVQVGITRLTRFEPEELARITVEEQDVPARIIPVTYRQLSRFDAEELPVAAVSTGKEESDLLPRFVQAATYRKSWFEQSEEISVTSVTGSPSVQTWGNPDGSVTIVVTGASSVQRWGNPTGSFDRPRLFPPDQYPYLFTFDDEIRHMDFSVWDNLPVRLYLHNRRFRVARMFSPKPTTTGNEP